MISVDLNELSIWNAVGAIWVPERIFYKTSLDTWNVCLIGEAVEIYIIPPVPIYLIMFYSPLVDYYPHYYIDAQLQGGA
jgi:hypothetical protein